MPTINPLGSLFGPNPFRSLQDHIRVVVQCADQVPPLFEALAQQDRQRVTQIKDSIFELENEADRIKNELRGNLPRGLFMPVERTDLLELLDLQDSIADVAQDIAGILYERQMVIPDPMVEPLAVFVDACVKVCHQAADVIRQLDELLELGFRGKEADHVIEMISALGSSEAETDDLGIELTRLLFSLEASLDPVSVIFWYRLLEWIGDLADYSEKVGNRLRVALAR